MSDLLDKREQCDEVEVHANFGRVCNSKFEDYHHNHSLRNSDAIEAMLAAAPLRVVVRLDNATPWKKGSMCCDLQQVLRAAARTAAEFEIKTEEGGEALKVQHMPEWLLATPGAALYVDKVIASNWDWDEDYVGLFQGEGRRLTIGCLEVHGDMGSLPAGKAFDSLLRYARFNKLVVKAVDTVEDNQQLEENARDFRAALAVANVGVLDMYGPPAIMPSEADAIERVVWRCCGDWQTVLPLRYERLALFHLYVKEGGSWIKKDVDVRKRRRD